MSTRRPKPIPPDPEEMNEQRAGYAQEAIAVFLDVCATDMEDAVADLLCDLRHWCDRHNFSFAHEAERAFRMYKDETRAPDPVTPATAPPPTIEPPF